MRRPSTSTAALAVAFASLFTALGGTSMAASLLIGTHQIKNHAVTASKLAPNSVNSSKVADGSLQGSDIAPNTFLPADGSAINALKLGNRPASDFMLGQGSMFMNRIQIPAGRSQLILSFGFGDLVGVCAAGGNPEVEYVSNTSSVNLVDSETDFGSPKGTAEIHTTNGLTRGGTRTVPNNGLPQSITWQAAFDDGTPHVATAWTSGQDILGTSCIFIGQAMASN